MTLEIRRAIATDTAALCALDSIVPIDLQRAEDIARWVREGHCHAALLDGVPAGYGVLEKSFFGRDFIELLMVGETKRRRGVGRALLRYLVDLCPSGEVWTSTNSSNTGMQELLAVSGFIECGVIHGLDPGDPELVYRKTITPAA